jgi:ribosome-associated translation inhibitor RaiA
MIDFIVTNGRELASGRARARLTRTLETHGMTTARVTVSFTDENGPKGGRAMRCAIELRLPRRAPVRAEHTATTLRLALDGALDTVEGEVTKLIERWRDAARHPKKYYAAARLLSGPGRLRTRTTEERP